MKRLVVAAVAFAGVAVSGIAWGQERVVIEQPSGPPRVEAGVELGYPTGVSFKFWLDRFDAIDASLDRRFFNAGYVGHADYLVHTRSILAPDSGMQLPFYAGAGSRVVRFDDGSVAIGPRVPVGVEAILTDMPVSFFAEFAPAIEVQSGSGILTADADIGARLVF